MSNERNELAELIWDEDACDWRQFGPNDLADAILAAGYRKTEPDWLDTLDNDGTYEYTQASDCRGENIVHYRRKPGRDYKEQPHAWERYEREAAK